MSEPLAPMKEQPNQTQRSGDSDKLWLVIRSLKGPDGKAVSLILYEILYVQLDYKIRKFDVIKLGRVRFKVKDFKFTNSQKCE